MYDTILFDLDGTLTDPKEGITNCVRYALESFGIYETDMNVLMRFIGPPLYDAFMEYYHMSSEEAERATAKYRERFTDIGIFENKAFEGTVHLLKTLKEHGKTVVLATAKPQVFAERILEHFGLMQYFDFVVGAEFHGERRTKQAVIGEVLKRLPPDAHAVMVGDREQDVSGAKAHGLPCIGVRFGYAEPNELEDAGAIAIAEDMDELLNMLL